MPKSGYNDKRYGMVDFVTQLVKADQRVLWACHNAVQRSLSMQRFANDLNADRYTEVERTRKYIKVRDVRNKNTQAFGLLKTVKDDGMERYHHDGLNFNHVVYHWSLYDRPKNQRGMLNRFVEYCAYKRRSVAVVVDAPDTARKWLEAWYDKRSSTLAFPQYEVDYDKLEFRIVRPSKLIIKMVLFENARFEHKGEFYHHVVTDFGVMKGKQ